MTRGSIWSFSGGSRLASSLSRSAADRSAPASSGWLCRSEENFVCDARSTARADDLTGSDAKRRPAHASSESFPAKKARPVRAAIASPVCEGAWFMARAASFPRERTRALDLAPFAASQRANQQLEPTRLAGAVLPDRPLRSTVLRTSKGPDCARQRAAHH